MEVAKQINLLDKVTAQYRPLIEAMQGEVISKNETQSIESIRKSLINAMAYTNAKELGDLSAINFIAAAFYKEAVRKYPYARLGEIDLSFKKGALKEFGDYFGFNVQTCWGWFKKYQESNELIQAKREWVNLVEESYTSKKPMQRIEVTIEQIKAIFEDYKNGVPLPAYARIWYDRLCELKNVKSLIEDDAERKKIRDLSRQEYENSLRVTKMHIKHPETFKQMLEHFTTDSSSFASISKKNALKSYFNKLISEGKGI
jgi:ASC-1-like (ASCH) protein